MEPIEPNCSLLYLPSNDENISSYTIISQAIIARFDAVTAGGKFPFQLTLSHVVTIRVAVTTGRAVP